MRLRETVLMRKSLVTRITAIMMASVILLTACGSSENAVPLSGDGAGAYIYHDYTSQLCTNWNPHTYVTAGDSYPLSFIESSLYTFIYNDELHPVEGKKPFEHYCIVPEMAEAEPEDITAVLKDERPEFNIPADAEAGYAFKVRLRDDLCWDDGTPINAYTFEESFKRLLDPKLVNYRASEITTGSGTFAGAAAYAAGETADYSGVGLYADGERDVVYVFEAAQSGYYLYAALTNFFLIKPDLYDNCLKETKTASGSVWSSSYNTGVSNSPSYGPYKISSFQTDKSIRFVRNEKWFGYKDGNHKYVDPIDGKTYDMYQTTEIDCQVVAEEATAKRMFFAGELMTHSLSGEDFNQYRNSEFCHSYPGTGTYFLILNRYEDVIEKREDSPDFDRSVKDIETQLLDPFRKAVSLSIDRELFAGTLYPGSSGGYGLFSDSVIYDPDNLLYYRDTDEAMETLCSFYSVDPADYPSLISAEESITGYDQKAAGGYYQQAFNESLDKGYITDNDGDGISDQTVTLLYSVSADDDKTTRLVEYLNGVLSKASEGTGFENRIKIEKSAPVGNEWFSQFMNGLTDICFMSWNGGAMNPFSSIAVYTYPEYAVTANWFDSSEEYMELEINGENVRLNLVQWTDALNGSEVISDGRSYNFGEGQADVNVRLQILSALENRILETNDYIPLMCANTMALLSQQIYYPTDTYNPVMRFGGISYIRYNYDEKDWKEHVKELGGTLKY